MIYKHALVGREHNRDWTRIVPTAWMPESSIPVALAPTALMPAGIVVTMIIIDPARLRVLAER